MQNALTVQRCHALSGTNSNCLRARKKYFAHCNLFSITDHVQRLLIVGPSDSEWKVLRETEGERFVALEKGVVFKGEFATEKKQIDAKRFV